MRNLLNLLLFFTFFSVQAQDLEEEFLNQMEANDPLVEEMEATLEQAQTSSKVLIKRDEYLMYSLEHRKEVFNWQLQASKWIFVIVMLIVISGLVLSYMHFYKSLKNPGGSSDQSELDMSTSGIKMNSSVIGLMILVLAIAFLYLYLIHVFPINEFNIDNSGMS
jgi:hypothetical protein